MRTITLELKTIGEWIQENKLDEANLEVVTWTMPKMNHSWGEDWNKQSDFDLKTDLVYWDEGDCGGYFTAEVYGRGDTQLVWNSDYYYDNLKTFCHQEVRNTPNHNFYEICDDLFILMEDYEILKHHNLFDAFVEEHTEDLTDD